MTTPEKPEPFDTVMATRMKECNRCRALVLPDALEAHLEWHETWNGGR